MLLNELVTATGEVAATSSRLAKVSVLASLLRELDADEIGPAIGFLTATAGAYKNLVKIRPPLVIQREDIVGFLTTFEAVMLEMDAAS